MKGKKLTKTLMSILLVLLSIAVIVIAFVGVYVPKLNKLENIIPDYKLGTEIDGIIEYRLSVDNSEEEKDVYVDSEGKIRGYVIEDETSTEVTEEGEETTEEVSTNETGFSIETRTIKANEESALTKENFEKTKSLIESRLEKAGATEYAIRMDEVSGDMVIELSQNDNIQYLYEFALNSKGIFEIIDNQTGVVLLDKTHLESTNEYSYFDQESNSYTVYLQVNLTEEGTEILKGISQKYIEYTDDSGETQIDYIAIQIDGESVMTTYFDETYTQSVINIPIGQGVSADEVNTYIDTVADIAYSLNNEEMPVQYKLDNNALFIQSGINENTMKIFDMVIIALLILVAVIFIIKFKLSGLVAGILNAALVGLVILVLKYVKVVVSLSSMVALIGVIIINFVFMMMYLKKLKNKEDDSYLETLKSFYAIMFPVIVIAFIFTFFVSTTVTGLGSVLFWGLLLQIIFNTIVGKYVLETK